MSRRPVDPLRELTAWERAEVERLGRATAGGQSYTAAAHAAGCRSGDGVAKLVARFNREGVAALGTRHGGGPTPVYAAAERAYPGRGAPSARSRRGWDCRLVAHHVATGVASGAGRSS